MSDRDLLQSPLCAEVELGLAIPPSNHAVSVCLPTWASCIGYEERDPAVIDRLQAGYPRFVRHPLIRDLTEQSAAQFGWSADACTPAIDTHAAHYMADHCVSRGFARPDIAATPFDAIHLLHHGSEAAVAIKECWQHRGMNVPSRQAAAALQGVENAVARAHAAQDELRALLAQWYRTAAAHIAIHANGMAAIAAAHDLVRQRKPGAKTIQVGFPYVDLLKLQEHFGSGVHFIPGFGQAAVDQVVDLLKGEDIAGIFIEVPGNPLLTCIDVRQLAEHARAAEVPIIIDDSVASPLNIDLHGLADLVVGSLTKYVSGFGDVMGGAVVALPDGPCDGAFIAPLQQQNEAPLWYEDAELLLQRSRGYPERLADINHNALEIVTRLRAHPAVKHVHFPDICANYASLLSQADFAGGYGGLCSIIFHDEQQAGPAFYDALGISKGPSFGTEYSLACPFTQLAHYHELDWAEGHGVSPWLIRVGIGREDTEVLWSRLAAALATLPEAG